MKIIHSDYKKGIVKVRADDNEDLWSLRKIISEGDTVSGETTRVIKKEDREGIRKKAYIKLKAEKIEFMESSYTLKILGKIIEGPEDVPKGSYHSFNINEGDEITIEKEWSTYDKEELKKREKKTNKTLITIIDRQDATHALVTSEVKELYTHESRLPRKDQNDYEKRVNEYHKEVINQIKELITEHKAKNVIIAGPGFSAEQIVKELNKEGVKTIKSHTNQTGMSGVKELIGSGALKELVKEDEVSEETMIVEEFFRLINKDKLIKYGFNSVKEAVEKGAVKELIISEQLVIEHRERKTFKELEHIINMAESTGTKVEFIGVKHEAGKRFIKFGGIGAILRYQI